MIVDRAWHIVGAQYVGAGIFLLSQLQEAAEKDSCGRVRSRAIFLGYLVPSEWRTWVDRTLRNVLGTFREELLDKG